MPESTTFSSPILFPIMSYLISISIIFYFNLRVSLELLKNMKNYSKMQKYFSSASNIKIFFKVMSVNLLHLSQSALQEKRRRRGA